MNGTSSLGFLAIGIAVTLESCGQVLFKRGTQRPGAPGGGLHGALRRSVGNHWIQAGLVAFTLEAVAWTFALRYLPLDVAFPMGSACFVLVAILSKFYLREEVGPRRWLGVLLILAGVVLIGATR